MKNILRIFASALLLMLVFSASALAAEKALMISYTGPATLSEGQTAQMLTTKIKKPGDGTVVYTLTDTVKKTVIYSKTETSRRRGWPFQGIGRPGRPHRVWPAGL